MNKPVDPRFFIYRQPAPLDKATRKARRKFWRALHQLAFDAVLLLCLGLLLWLCLKPGI